MELLIAIAVLAILTTLAVPAFTQFVQNNKLSAQANEMVAAMQYARSEALRRGEQVRVCSSSDGAACNGNWNQGWIAMVDPGGDDEEVLRVWQSPDANLQFDPADGIVDFTREGFSTAAAEQQFDMQREGCTNDSARRVLVESSGRVAADRIDCT
jgi:type IV fimbrial biogenesis protein FimT